MIDATNQPRCLQEIGTAYQAFGDLRGHLIVLLRLEKCTLINIGRKNQAEGDHVLGRCVQSRSSHPLTHSVRH